LGIDPLLENANERTITEDNACMRAYFGGGGYIGDVDKQPDTKSHSDHSPSSHNAGEWTFEDTLLLSLSLTLLLLL
jgi:hypothetical protein